jgi:predicted nucleic acid-binding protein
VDTSVLVSGFLSERGASARVVDAWVQGAFTLCCAPAQVAEVAAVLQRPELGGHLQPQRAAQVVEDLKRLSEPLTRMRLNESGSDPASNALLGLADAGQVDVLVVADASPLRALGLHGGVKIRTAREFAVVLATR